MIKFNTAQATRLMFALALAGFVAAPAYAVVIETGAQQSVTSTAQISASQAGPSPLFISLMLRKLKCKTGENLDISVSWEWKDGVKISRPMYPQPWGDWVLISSQEGKAIQKEKGSWQRIDKLKIMTFMDGKVEIPALAANFQVPGKPPVEYRSAVVTIEVEPKVNKKGELEASLHDIKNPIWMVSFWHILLALLVAAVLLVGIAWYSKKAGLLGGAKNLEPIRPPEDVARERLKSLKESDLLAQGNFKAYYIELTDILRHYLEGRYSISAPDRTTAELMKELKRILERKDILTLRDLLERSDMIKFAKGSPDSKEIEIDWNVVKEFVEQTTMVYQNSLKTEIKSNSENNHDLSKNGNNITTTGSKL